MSETNTKEEIKFCKNCGMQTRHEVTYLESWAGDPLILVEEREVKKKCLSPNHKVSDVLREN